ncbi:MAG: hypothetical protein JO143_02605, partial [Acetobacteraceae bacterium]|nr:hypothetical protein [Acetobacteraceae bacterium]
MRPAALFAGCWGIWALSWAAAARWSSAPVLRPEPERVRVAHALLALGAFLTIPLASAWMRAPRLWDVG